MEDINIFFSSHKDWLSERALIRAKKQGDPLLAEIELATWHDSFVKLTKALSKPEEIPEELLSELSPSKRSNAPVASFATEKSQLSQERVINLASSMGLLKVSKKTYLDCIFELAEKTDKDSCCLLVNDFFDQLEISLCADWTKKDNSICTYSINKEQSKLLALLESLATPVMLLDYDLKIETMNFAAADFLGLADEQRTRYNPQQQPANQQIKPISLKDVAPWLAETLNQSCIIEKCQHECQFNISANTATGLKHFNISIARTSELSNEFTGYAVSLDDITFQVEIKKQLANERNRATHYLDIVGSIVVVLDVSGAITLINKTGCLTLGYEEHELLGQNWIDIVVPKEQSDEMRDYLDRISSSQVEIDDEHTNYITTKEGQHRLISWKNRLITNEENIPIGVLSAGMDITEQREIEEALAEKELWLRNTFVALGEAVLILTPDRIIIDANPAAEAMFQMENEELDGLPVENLHIDSEHYREFGELSQKAFAKGEDATFEFFLRRKDGEIFPTEHSVSLITGDDGAPIGIVSVIRDISNRKKAEQVLIQSEEKFRRIFETIEEGYIVSDLTGNIKMVNPATCSLLGYTEMDLIGSEMWQLYSNIEERTRFKSAIAAKGKVRGFHMTALRKDGSTITLETNAHLVRDENGLPAAIEGTFRDITERIEADKILREREKQYRSFFENNHAIMLLVDPQTGEIIDANPAASNFYGYPCDTMRTMNVSDITGQTEAEIYQEMVRAKQEKRVYFIFKHKLSNGELRDVEVYSGPIMVRGNQLLYSVIHDVTERIRMEREMKRLATTDTLTGVNNRHQFFSLAAQELTRSKRYKHPMTILMLDIDYFKSINDTHGHQAGDVVLKALSTMAITTLREIDVFGRIGGEEFAAALPDTNLEAGVLVANRLRAALAKLKVKVKNIEITFTVSIGATLARSEDQNIEETINRADEALYKAKKTGRNKVEKN